MAAEVEWWKIPQQSLALAAREAGFDLSVYDDYDEPVRAALKTRAISNAIERLREAFTEVSGRSLEDVKRGVYVISLSYPFTLDYNGWRSDVVYIGRGYISGRIKSHYEHSLFRLMRTLAGADFDFHLTEPKSEEESYFKHVEFLMLDYFKSKAGRYPLLNKNAGSKQSVSVAGTGWKKPLKRSGRKPIWEVRPTEHWDIDVLD
jgi:hypothetical protein